MLYSNAMNTNQCVCAIVFVNLLIIIMSQEAAVHIGPEIICDEVEVVNNEVNFICCKCSKKVGNRSIIVVDS